MELWLAASLFFGGAFSFWIMAKLMDLGHSYTFVKEMTDQVVMLLISCSQDVAFIKKIKYETMETMDIDEEQIKLLKSIDKKLNKVTISSSLFLNAKSRSKAQGRGNKTNLNVNFKTVTGKRGDTIRPLVLSLVSQAILTPSSRLLMSAGQLKFSWACGPIERCRRPSTSPGSKCSTNL